MELKSHTKEYSNVMKQLKANTGNIGRDSHMEDSVTLSPTKVKKLNKQTSKEFERSGSAPDFGYVIDRSRKRSESAAKEMMDVEEFGASPSPIPKRRMLLK